MSRRIPCQVVITSTSEHRDMASYYDEFETDELLRTIYLQKFRPH